MRWIAWLSLLCCGSLSSAASEPTVVLQIQPVDRLMTIGRQSLRELGGPFLAGLLDTQLAAQLGRKPFDGIDITKPWGIVGQLQGPLQDHYAVLIVPITGEKTFFDFLLRAGCPLQLEDHAPPDTYRFPPLVVGEFTMPFFVRCHKTHAYIAMGSPQALKPERLPNPEWITPTGEELATLRIRVDRLGMVYKKLAQLTTEFGLWDDPQSMPAVLREVQTLTNQMRARWYQRSLHDARELTITIEADPKTGQLMQRLRLSGLPDSELSRTLLARQRSTNVFAGFLQNPGTMTLVTQGPQFDEYLSKVVAHYLTAAARPPLAQPLIDFIQVWAKTWEQGETAFAIQLTDETWLAALSLESTAALADAMKPYRQRDGEYLIDITRLELPVQWVQWIGSPKELRVKLTPTAVFAAAGPDAKARLADAVKVQAGPAPALVWRCTPGKLAAWADLHEIDRPLSLSLLQRLPANTPFDLLRLDVEGGAEMNLSFRIVYWLFLGT